MPKITREVNVDTYVDVDVDISVEDFFNEMEPNDVELMIKLLKGKELYQENEETIEYRLSDLENDKVIKELAYLVSNTTLDINLDLLVEEIQYYKG